MASLQIKGIQDDLYADIKRLAAAENRSVSQQVLFLLKQYLARTKHLNTVENPGQVLLALSGSWEDDRSVEEIIGEIKEGRKNSRKLARGF
ncbi:MAG: hypothetical protein JRJ03_16260 [Deltaproteobacteria bacterium]|nr:hypothetical protein [Deltaproteobacteria bacterium]